MISWLSELEAWEEKEKDEDIKCMARVIRELARAIKKVELGYRLDIVINKLPPDAKEVIDELAE